MKSLTRAAMADMTLAGMVATGRELDEIAAEVDLERGGLYAGSNFVETDGQLRARVLTALRPE